MSRFAWEPTPEQMEESNLVPFMRHVGIEGNDYEALLAWSKGDPERFWDTAIRFLDLRFPVPWERVRDTSEGLAWTRWCIGGRTNAVINCIERHRGTPTEDRPASAGRESEATFGNGPTGSLTGRSAGSREAFVPSGSDRGMRSGSTCP